MFSFFKKAPKVVTEQNCQVGDIYTDAYGNKVICLSVTTNSMGKRLVGTRPAGLGDLSMIQSSLTNDEIAHDSMWRD